MAADAGTVGTMARVQSHVKAESRHGECGFVLLTVLVVTTIVSALAIAVMIAARENSRSLAIEAQRVEAEALSDAGLTRIIAALEDADDPMLSALLRTGGTPVIWRYAGRDIALSITMEAGMVDLNSGQPALIRALIRSVIDDPVKNREMLARWEAMRRQGKPLETVIALLDPQDRLRPEARKLEALFTTVTGAQGVDPLAASDTVLSNIPSLTDADRALIAQARISGSRTGLNALRARFRPLLDGERPLYRIHASAVLPNGITVRRSALAAQDLKTRKIEISDVFRPQT